MPDPSALVRRVVRRFGFDLTRDYGSPTARRMKILARYNISLLFDVGANLGQYGLAMREMGYGGKLVSFEPLPEPYAVLEKAAAADPHWNTVNAALGAENATAWIHVSAHDTFSSLLQVTPLIEHVNKNSSVVRKQEIKVQRLDTVFAEYYSSGDAVAVKIDTQGFEPQVVLGAAGVLDKIRGFQLEMSLVRLYENEMLLAEMVKFMEERGYTLVSIEPGYTDPQTAQMLQVDGLFMRL